LRCGTDAAGLGISTGVYGYPSESAASVALSSVRKWLEENDNAIDKVVFCLFLDKDIKAYEAELPKWFPPTQDDLNEADS